MIKIGSRTLLLLLAAGVAALVYYSPTLRTFFTAFTTSVQELYHDAAESVEEGVRRHWRQAETIDAQRKTIRRLEADCIRCRSEAAEFEALRRALGIRRPDINMTVVPVRALGYVRLGNFQQVWLEDFPEFNPLRNYGVVRDGKAVGIVVEQRRRPLMILAGDKECKFAVYIGAAKAPGIAVGRDARHMTVRYIPEWMRVKPGDEVFTSGLDRIYPPGIPVGRVLSIRKMQGFKDARIELYGDTLHPDYVWVVAP